MPKIVDHAARRQAIVEAYLDLVRKQGIGSTSSRSLAAQLGISNSLLWRYFNDMNQLLVQSYHTIIQNVDDRIMFAIAGHRGVDAIRRMVHELLPLDDVSRAEARIVVSFWGLEVTKGTRLSPSAHETEAWSSILETLLRQAAEVGEIAHADDRTLRDTAFAIMALTNNAQIGYATKDDDAVAVRTEHVIGRMLTAE
ncbi:TetR/AcrR family transcriptional regulator [Bifidobacterium sp. 82T24]|uniref:TetR/AcrR family transcriptional regulator n=1 Tax=Bifidobacterium pluvialisilvae TaxID=2834436 RepID=UPI001C58FBA0|nr:TetR/AcrR family transcriptional regulator [Bifidobacterium pluvialisilvae]MBW3088991.1 TetR/AcrR family transcriptional regulator [Bifidobacterium pluvialisilvae]